MSEAHKAVFLSYASQDAEAAKRICEALRQAGVEVWFDQSELVGGDAWDQKIRRQIKECALFVPIITPNTNFRPEGYFRLEWKLAVDRSHLLADDHPFLFPIVIGDVADATARVPDKFRDVQWTRLRLDETPAELAARVLRLLAGNPPGPERPGPGGASEKPLVKKSRPAWQGIAWAAVGLFFAVIYAVHPMWTPARPKDSKPSVSAAAVPLSEARQLVEKAWLLANQNNPDAYRAAADLAEKATQLDSTDGEVWATAGLLDIICWVQTDSTEKREEMARTKVLRAKSLAPRSVRARLAEAKMLTELDLYPDGGAKAEAILRELNGENLTGWEATMVLGDLFLALCKQGRAFEGAKFVEQAARADAGWLNAASWAYLSVKMFPEALAASRQQTEREPIPGLLQQVRIQLVREDLDAALAALDQLPAAARTEEVPASARVQVAYYRRDAAQMQAAGRFIPGDYVSNGFLEGPKAAIDGLADFIAGRPEAAKVKWESALAGVDQRLAADRTAVSVLQWRLRLLALLGRQDEAGRTYLVLQQLHGGPGYRGESQDLVMLGRKEEALARLEFELRQPSDLFAHYSARFGPMYDPLRGDPRFEKLLRDTLPPGAKPFPDQGTADGKQKTAEAVDTKSIAVLPFENMSEDKDSGYFADGVQEDLLTNLASLKELRVVSRTSVERYRKTDKAVPQIARELGVAYLLEGSVRRAGNKVRVTGQLIRAATDEHLWAKSYDRDLSDIFAIQSELAQAIAGELKAAISPAEVARVEDRPTKSLEAYDLFLRGRDNYNRQGAYGTADQVRQTIQILQRAVEIDPQFTRAWGLLAAAHGEMIELSYDQSESRKEQMQAAVAQTERCAPDSFEAHAARSVAYYALRDYAGAYRELEWLQERFPLNGDVVGSRAFIQRRWGRWAEALATLCQAEALDPGSVKIAQNIALHLWEMRRYAEARVAYRRLLELRPEELEPARLPAGLATLDFLERGSTAEGDAYFAALGKAELSTPAMLVQRKTWLWWKGDGAGFAELESASPDQNFVVVDAMVMASGGAGPAAIRAKLQPFLEQMRGQLSGEPENWNMQLQLALAEAVAGDSRAALADTAQALKLMPVSNDAFYGGNALSLASSVYAWAGETERAIALLQERQNIPPLNSVHVMKNSVGWWPLRNDPRFKALVNDPKNNAPVY